MEMRSDCGGKTNLGNGAKHLRGQEKQRGSLEQHGEDRNEDKNETRREVVWKRMKKWKKGKGRRRGEGEWGKLWWLVMMGKKLVVVDNLASLSMDSCLFSIAAGELTGGFCRAGGIAP